MSLLNEAKAATPVAGTKKSNSDYQKRARAKALESATLIRDELKKKNIELSDQGKEALAYLCKEGRASGGGAFGTPVLYKIFGNTPKKGDKVTALKVFETTGKGFAEMRKLMKQWEEKSKVIVKYDEASKSYIVDSDVPAYNG